MGFLWYIALQNNERIRIMTKQQKQQKQKCISKIVIKRKLKNLKSCFQLGLLTAIVVGGLSIASLKTLPERPKKLAKIAMVANGLVAGCFTFAARHQSMKSIFREVCAENGN